MWTLSPLSISCHISGQGKYMAAASLACNCDTALSLFVVQLVCFTSSRKQINPCLSIQTIDQETMMNVSCKEKP